MSRWSTMRKILKTARVLQAQKSKYESRRMIPDEKLESDDTQVMALFLKF